MKYVSELKELEGIKFDSIKELEAAEAEVSEKEKAKQKAIEVRKADAELVKSTIVNTAEVKARVKKAKLDAYKAYLAKLDELDKLLEEAENEENKQLKEFCKKHPEGFHETIKIGDVEYKCDYSTNVDKPISLFDVFSKFWF